jgi:hypothetical protein
MEKDDCKLSRLAPEVQDAIEEMSRLTKATALVEFLQLPPPDGFGVSVSLATLYRFLRRRTERRLNESAEEMNEAARGAAAKLNRPEFRKGTMAMLQQRMYEEALTTGNPELVKEAYRMLSEEDAREAELQLAARRTAVAEEHAKAARRKVELAAANSALALLPKLREILLREGATEAEIVKEARKCLLAGGGELLRSLEASELAAKSGADIDEARVVQPKTQQF